MIGVALVVGVGNNVPNGFAALHCALVERQGDGSLVQIDLAGLQVLIRADEFALHLRRLRTEIGRRHIGPDCRRRRLDFRGFEILRERRSRRRAKHCNSQCCSLDPTCLGPPSQERSIRAGVGIFIGLLLVLNFSAESDFRIFVELLLKPSSFSPSGSSRRRPEFVAEQVFLSTMVEPPSRRSAQDD